jgi:hypothetical protein
VLRIRQAPVIRMWAGPATWCTAADRRATADEPASAALPEHGVIPKPWRPRSSAVAGSAQAADLLCALDREALASIGIDLDAMRARRSDRDALTRAGPAPTGRGGLRCGRTRCPPAPSAPHRADRRAPADPGMIPLTVPEIARLLTTRPATPGHTEH